MQTEAYLLLDLCTESLADRLAASHEVKILHFDHRENNPCRLMSRKTG